jgi:hypothetical protein
VIKSPLWSSLMLDMAQHRSSSGMISIMRH